MSTDNPIQINNGVYRDIARQQPAADPGVIPVPDYATEHQIAVRIGAGDTATGGTLALTGIPLGSDTETVITDEAGDPVVFDLADLATLSVVRVSGVWEEFILTPTAVDGTYTTEATGWL